LRTQIPELIQNFVSMQCIQKLGHESREVHDAAVDAAAELMILPVFLFESTFRRILQGMHLELQDAVRTYLHEVARWSSRNLGPIDAQFEAFYLSYHRYPVVRPVCDKNSMAVLLANRIAAQWEEALASTSDKPITKALPFIMSGAIPAPL